MDRTYTLRHLDRARGAFLSRDSSETGKILLAICSSFSVKKMLSYFHLEKFLTSCPPVPRDGSVQSTRPSAVHDFCKVLSEWPRRKNLYAEVNLKVLTLNSLIEGRSGHGQDRKLG